MKLCECGCGHEVSKLGNRFIHGHNGRGGKMSDEARENMSNARIGMIFSDKHKANISKSKSGKNNPNYGKPRSKETIIKIKISNLNVRDKAIERTTKLWEDDEYRKNLLELRRTAEFRNNARKNTIKQFEDENNREAQRIMMINKWKEVEFRYKMSLRPIYTGENNPNWKGGISFDPYCEKFNEVKKKEVRNKYNNCDYLTGIHRDICNIVSDKIQELSVHHVDYNKMQGCNDIPWKLIPVSRRHNTMFNKNRSFWKRLILYALEYDEEYTVRLE